MAHELKLILDVHLDLSSTAIDFNHDLRSTPLPGCPAGRVRSRPAPRRRASTPSIARWRPADRIVSFRHLEQSYAEGPL